MIRHEIEWSMLLSFRVQICLLSSVEFLCLAWRNDAVWFLYRVLKSFSVSPMYVSEVLLLLHVTVAAFHCVLTTPEKVEIYHFIVFRRTKVLGRNTQG